MAADREDKRHFQRLHSAVPVKLRTNGTSFPQFAEATDLSLGGCYVRLLSPLSVGMNLDIFLWLDGVKLSLRGRVRTADSGVGNGIAFTDMNEDQRSRLVTYLNTIASTANSFILR